MFPYQTAHTGSVSSALIWAERKHIHVRRERKECKVWIEPNVELSWNSGFADHEVNDILRLVCENLPPKIIEAAIDTRHLRVRIDSGITVLMPLEHVPTLLLATDEERDAMEVFEHSIHWEVLDCDLSVEGLLAGAKEMLGLARKAWGRFLARQYGTAA